MPKPPAIYPMFGRGSKPIPHHYIIDTATLIFCQADGLIVAKIAKRTKQITLDSSWPRNCIINNYIRLQLGLSRSEISYGLRNGKIRKQNLNS